MADREIKFRGRDDLGVWREGNLILTQGMERVKSGILLSGKVADGSYVEITYFVDEHTVGQYTGLTDSNGNEIYEGDIVTWIDSDGSKRMDVVTWMNGGLCLCNDQYTIGNYASKDLHVIGNIHDNPELMEGEK